MNKMFKTMTVISLASGLSLVSSFAGAEKDMAKKIEDQGIYVETARPGVVLSGYVDAGYTYNFNGAGGSAATGAGNNAGGTRVAADSRAKGDFNMNAFKLALEKPLGDKNEFAAGFRADLMFGKDVPSVITNANNGTGAGANVGSESAVGVEQAYVQFRAPVGNGLDFKVGKFVTIMGYEVTERPANLNITYGNLFNTMIPLAHTGVLASYKFNDIVDVKGGVVNGWGDTNGVTAAKDGYGVLGSVNVNAPGGNANIQNSFYAGLNGDTNVGGPGLSTATRSGVIYVYDVWGNWKPKFAKDKLLLGFNGDFGGAPNGNALGVAPTTGYDNWYGVALYSKYQFTDIFSLAGRLDWAHDNDGANNAGGNLVNGKFGGFPNVAGNTDGHNFDVYSYTLTAGFDVWANMLLRAEYRADIGSDWTPSNSGATTGNGRWGVSHMVAAEVVYSF